MNEIQNFPKENIYSSQVVAKNGSKVSSFKNGKSFYSLYNPEKDSENFCKNEAFFDSDFIVVGGIGNGYHIEQIRKINKKAFIICYEINEMSFNYLKNEIKLSNLCKDYKIIFTYAEKLKDTIIQNFIPSIYHHFFSCFVRSWQNYNEQFIKDLNSLIDEAINIIQDDFSVQKYFGKIWMKNILENILYSNKMQKKIDVSVKSTCAIVAAGPSLDSSILNLKKNQDDFTILATDTSLQVLLEHKIIPDFVFFIDAQTYSCEHLINHYQKQLKNSIFILDLCSNSSISKNLLRKNFNFIFFNSGHPFCSCIENYSQTKFLNLSTGMGTVTSCCFSFAKNFNFEKIVFFGSDFSYIGNKSYCKGTYLEKKFLNIQNKINTNEFQNTKLMYRTKCFINEQNNLTSRILENYKQAQMKLNELTNALLYNAVSNPNPLNLKEFTFCTKKTDKKNIEKITFPLKNPYIESKIFNLICEHLKKTDINEESNLRTALLPFFAYHSKSNYSKNDLLNIANKLIHNYTV
ncbi:MAG: 6-hydroxymethylpterin diphosphokinase MptE-like protein [Treponemataceae bacterium]